MSDPRLSEWLALRRVQQGGVAKVAGIYLDHGYLVRDYLTAVLDRLIWAGLLQVAAGDPVWELRRLSLTDAGQARYAVLHEYQQQVALPVPPAAYRGGLGPGRVS